MHSDECFSLDYDLNDIEVGSRVASIPDSKYGTVMAPDGSEVGDAIPVKWDNGDDIYHVIPDSIAVILPA